MKSSSVLALLVLVAVIVAGLMALARTPASETPGGLAPVHTSGTEPAGDSPAPTGPEDLEHEAGSELHPSGRATVPEGADEPGQGTLQLVASDAITGQPVPRFWMKQDAMVDAASTGGPFLSDPDSGTVTLAHTEWDAADPLEKRSFLVSSPRHTPQSVELNRPRRDGEKLTLRLLRAASIVGTVRDGSSAPLPSARVTLQYHGPAADFTGELGEPVPLPDSYQGSTLRLTDAEGEYAFSQLPPGVYVTQVQQATALHASDPIFVRPGEWSLGDHWLDEHVRLTVTVTQADGTASANTRILLVQAEPPLNESLDEGVEIMTAKYTDAEGRATVGPLSPGAYGVYIQSDDGVAAPMALEVAETSRSVLELFARLRQDESRQDESR